MVSVLLRKILFFGWVLLSVRGFGQTPPKINVIYGKQHIYTVETPNGWINDKEFAASVGLVSFFYARQDSLKQPKSYFYTMGYDKDEKNHTLKSFISGDMETFRKKYPDFEFKQDDITPPRGVTKAEKYSFFNLTDRYREEVVYLETESSVLVCAFSAFSKEDYTNYRKAFKLFVASLHYRGNDPKRFIEWYKRGK